MSKIKYLDIVPDKMPLSELSHIKDVSSYNSNYYSTKSGKLLYGSSDDDRTTYWYLIRGQGDPFFLGYSDVYDDYITRLEGMPT